MNIQRLVTSNQLSNAIRGLVFSIEMITARSDIRYKFGYKFGYKFDIYVYESKFRLLTTVSVSFSLFPIYASVVISSVSLLASC